jgi:short-subunit dehydrogenase
MTDNQRVVLITGASSGIGYATALAFAKQGMHVVGCARREENLLELQQSINDLSGQHGDFLPVAADVRDPSAMFKVVEQTLTKFGRLDVLVANAGLGHRGSLVDSDWDDIETLMRTNMDGVLHSIRAAVPAMREGQRGGHIIIVSSIVYNMASPYAAVYAASKAFVSSIAKSLRLELEKDNIRVTDMLIGRTQSEFSEKRLGKSGRSGGGIPIMPTDKVAEAIVKASNSNKKAVALRWIDRAILLGNALIPNVIGRQAMKQYK